MAEFLNPLEVGLGVCENAQKESYLFNTGGVDITLNSVCTDMLVRPTAFMALMAGSLSFKRENNIYSGN